MSDDAQDADSGSTVKVAAAWTFVGVPLLYGLITTANKAAALFIG